MLVEVAQQLLTSEGDQSSRSRAQCVQQVVFSQVELFVHKWSVVERVGHNRTVAQSISASHCCAEVLFFAKGAHSMRVFVASITMNGSTSSVDPIKDLFQVSFSKWM